ncbi:dynamin family protein [uncultured Brachyspira sp.]|uniref:dynamin family protein n=1 Tax=uncultured Brachyspira sp. TaxID=221953 RepID=UPI0026180105|nr:dynamin family protein [uncultured Brachyspira sp.]
MSSLDNITTETKRQIRKLNVLEEYINNLKKVFSNSDFSNVENQIKDHKDFIKEPDLQVAIVGSIKAGKSTFINAFLKENIASTEVTPETASLTKFKYSDKNHLVIRFYTSEEWKELWDSVEDSDKQFRSNVFKREYESVNADSIKNDYLNKSDLTINCADMDSLVEKVREYTSKRSAKHYFVKEIIVGINNENIPKEVMFVDTPGLNDVVSYRSDITNNYIKRANAVIVCVQSSNLTNDELLTILKVFENVGKDIYKVIVLGTKLDILNSPKSDWLKQKKEWFNYLIDKYKDENIMNSNILGVSSYVDKHLSDIEKGKDIDEDAIFIIDKFAKSFDINLKLDNSNIDKSLNPEEAYKMMKLNAIKKNIQQIKESTNINNINKLLKNSILVHSSDIVLKDLNKKFSNLIKDTKIKIDELKNETADMKSTLDMSENEKEAYILSKNEEMESLKESKIEVNNAFNELKQKWLEANNELKETLK